MHSKSFKHEMPREFKGKKNKTNIKPTFFEQSEFSPVINSMAFPVKPSGDFPTFHGT
jgi:hypothetical protein